MTLTTITRRLAIGMLLALTLTACGSSEDRQAKYYERAVTLFEAGDYERAQLEVKNVLQINKDHAGARYLWAQISEKQQNWKQMFANLSMAVELDPGLVGARVKLGQVYYLNRLYDKAMEQAEAVLALEPNSADGHTLRGSVLFKTGDRPGAIEEAQLALAAAPGHVGAISILTEMYREQDPELALAVIGDGIALQTRNATLKLLKISVLENQGDLDGVVDEYKTLIADYPENLFFHYRLVKFYEAHARIDEAESLLRDIVKTKPENLQLKLWLAEFIANQRNLALAESTVKEFIAKQPDIHELRFALGKIYTALRQYDDAIAAYQEVIGLDEKGADSQKARNEVVKLYLAQGQAEPATALLEEIFAIEPDNTDALITSSRLALARGNAQAAIPQLRTVVKNEPESLPALLLLAQAHDASGSANLALDNYRRALTLAPGNEDALLNVARLQIAQGEYETSEQLLTQFLDTHAGHLEASRLLIESYSRQQRWEESLTAAKVLEGNENSIALALYMKGRVFFARQQYAQAATVFAEVLQLEPGAIEALQYLLRSYTAEDNNDEAYNYLAAHLEQYPKHAHAQEFMGSLQRSRGEMDAAIDSFKAANAIDPNRLSALLALGRTYTQMQDYAAAAGVYKAGLQENPGNLMLMILLAGVHERTENYAAAVAVYEQALAINPTLDVAANNLAMILVDHLPSEENNARALELTKNFQSTDQPVFWDTLGWVYYKMGNYAQALPLFQKAVESQGEISTYRYHMGMTYLKLEDLESAKAELETALAAGDTFVGAVEAKEVLANL